MPKEKASKLPFYSYVDGVTSGKIVAGRFIQQAVERFVKDVDKKDFVFDYKAGERMISFAGMCNHWKGPKAGTPFILDPHQHFYLIQKYGWMDRDGLPRFRRSFKEIARKTGKTTEAALEALFHMAKGVEEAAQVFVGATKEDDAVLTVNDAGRIATASPALKGRFRVMIHEPYVRRVIYEPRNAFMTYMTKGHDGTDISMGIGDECHDWPDATIRNRIELGMGNRLAPMFSTITTAGYNKFGYCYSSLRHSSIQILNGSMEDDQQLILIFEMDEEDNWEDETVWVKANPNIPHSTTQLKSLQAQYRKAKNEGGQMEVAFKTKNLNMWTDAVSVWIQDDVWMKNAHGINEDDLKEVDCYGGLYTSGTESLNCFVLYFPDVRGKEVFKLWTWLPEKFVKLQNDKVDYQKWVPGFITETPGTDADHQFIAKDVLDICLKYQVQVIGFEQTFAQFVAPELEGQGIIVMQINQGFNNLGQQTALFQKMAREGKIEHFKNPVFRYQIGNVVTHRNAKDGTEKPDRGASGPRIGAVSAALNAMVAKFEATKNQMSNFTFDSIKL